MHPILLKLGSVTLYSWGLMVALGTILGVYLIIRAGVKAGFDANKILDGSFWTIVAGFLGARLVYVIYFWKDFSPRPWEALFIWQGGLVFYGGLAGSLLAAVLYLKINKLPVLKILDLAAPYAALGYIFVRLGCFLNGCCFGKICRGPWAVKFPQLVGLRHPTQLYEAAAGAVIFLILLFLKKRQKFDGQLVYSGIMVYSVWRFWVEFLRDDPPYFFYGLNAFQIASAVIFVIFLVPYLIKRFKTTRVP